MEKYEDGKGGKIRLGSSYRDETPMSTAHAAIDCNICYILVCIYSTFITIYQESSLFFHPLRGI